MTRRRKRSQRLGLSSTCDVYRLLVDEAADCIVRITPAMQLSFVNGSAARTFGITTTDLAAVDVRSLIHPDDLATVEEGMRRTLSPPYRSTFEERMQTTEGWRWFEWSNRALLDQAENVVEIVGIGRDVTERRERDRDLQLLRALVDRAQVGLMCSDTEGNMLNCNECFARDHGYEPSELTGRNLDIFVPDGRRASFDATFTPLKTTGAFGPSRVTHLRSDGSTFPCLVSLSRIEVEGRPVIVASAQDMSSQAALEDQLLRAQKMEALGRLAGGVAHDFNNLLTPIIGYAELLVLDDAVAATHREELDGIVAAAVRAQELTSHLMTLGRRQVLDPRPLDLGQVLSDLAPLLQRTLREDIALRLPHALSLPAVSGDAAQVDQVVMNLVVNAQDAMPDGGTLTLSLSCRELQPEEAREKDVKPGPYLLLGVADTGCGMTHEVIEKVFEPFFTTKSPDKGTGLGLSTVYGIARLHGGTVQVSTTPGHGSLFEVFFPCISEAAAADGRRVPAGEGPRGTETILVVEDDPRVRKLACRILARQGYRVIEAGDGNQALDVLDAHDDRLDLLLTDVVMPGMNGRDLARAVVARRPATKVVYMSGYAHDVLARHGVLEDGLQLVAKPFTVVELCRRVRAVLDGATVR